MTHPSIRAFDKAIQARALIDGEKFPDAAKSVENGIINLLNHIPACRKILRQVLSLKNPRLLAALFECHGAEVYICLQKNPDTRISLRSFYREGHFDLLRSLHASGFPIATEKEGLRHELLTNPSVDLFEFLLEDLQLSDLLFPYSTHAAILAVNGEAGAWLGNYMARMDPDLRETCVREIMLHISKYCRAKPLAYALTSGFDLMKMDIACRDISFYPEKIHPLLLSTKSAHGRLNLKSQAPDPAVLMSRFASETFFLLTDAELEL
jgi:hypothetical protein